MCAPLPATNAGPAADDALVSGLPVGIIGGEREARLNLNHQFGLVVEGQGHGGELRVGGHVDVGQGLAAGLGKCDGVRRAVVFGAFASP